MLLKSLFRSKTQKEIYKDFCSNLCQNHFDHESYQKKIPIDYSVMVWKQVTKM
jgi:hypothetical protein